MFNLKAALLCFVIGMEMNDELDESHPIFDQIKEVDKYIIKCSAKSVEHFEQKKEKTSESVQNEEAEPNVENAEDLEEVEESGEAEEESEPEVDYTHIDKLADNTDSKLQELGQRMRLTTQQDGLYDDALGT